MASLQTLKSIGIIGAGHLGTALAAEFLHRGWPGGALRISQGRTPETTERIRAAGLTERIAANEDIARSSSLIFLTVPPGDVAALANLPVGPNAVTVSCAAGISSADLAAIFGRPVIRFMPSGPDTIRRGIGIAALYPNHDRVREAAESIGFDVIDLVEEDDMHGFTAGICLPAALVLARGAGMDVAAGIAEIISAYPRFERVLSWAENSTEGVESDEERDRYVARLATKGGISERIVESYRAGETLLSCFTHGIGRSREIAARFHG